MAPKVEVGCRREEQVSTGNESASRGARRGIRWAVVTIALLIITYFDKKGKSFLTGLKKRIA